MKRSFLFQCIVFIGFISSGIAWGTDYPSKTITLIVSNAAGGSLDMLSRGIAPYLEKELNTPVRVEDLPGAGGAIAYTKVFKAAPDGYTLLTATIPNMHTVEILSENSRYRTTEFIPIFAMALDSVVLAVHPEVFKSFDDFAKAARSRTLSVGMVGRGSPTHLGALVIEKFLGAKFNYVPFEGGVKSTTTLAGKHIDAALSYTASALPMVQAGKIKYLLMLASERNQLLPDIPIPKEYGYDIPSIQTLVGIFSPPNTPPDKVRIIEAAFERAVKNPQYIEWRKKMPSEFIQLNGKAFKAEIEKQIRLVDAYKQNF